MLLCIRTQPGLKITVCLDATRESWDLRLFAAPSATLLASNQRRSNYVFISATPRHATSRDNVQQNIHVLSVGHTASELRYKPPSGRRRSLSGRRFGVNGGCVVIPRGLPRRRARRVQQAVVGWGPTIVLDSPSRTVNKAICGLKQYSQKIAIDRLRQSAPAEYVRRGVRRLISRGERHAARTPPLLYPAREDCPKRSYIMLLATSEAMFRYFVNI
jgi:hypothetical protein